MASFKDGYIQVNKDSTRLYLDKSDKNCFKEKIFIELYLFPPNGSSICRSGVCCKIKMDRVAK